MSIGSLKGTLGHKGRPADALVSFTEKAVMMRALDYDCMRLNDKQKQALCAIEEL
jgi:hypothetical protein